MVEEKGLEELKELMSLAYQSGYSDAVRVGSAIEVLLVTAVVGIGCVITSLLILRACQKMYTEYFKDRSMTNRSEGPKQ